MRVRAPHPGTSAGSSSRWGRESTGSAPTCSIQGVDSLGGGEHRIGPEHVEVASFAALAALTGGDVTIEDVEPDDLIAIIPAFRKLGIQMEVEERAVHVSPGQNLQVVDDLGGQIPKIESGIWPAFPPT